MGSGAARVVRWLVWSFRVSRQGVGRPGLLLWVRLFLSSKTQLHPVDGMYYFWYCYLWLRGPKRLPAYFYRTDSGREPVREWLQGLKPADRKIIGEDIKDVEFSWPIGMPMVRSLGRDLWEVRSSLTGDKIARVVFCVTESRMVLLHGFIKKSQKTPQKEIELALKRKKGEER